MTHALSFLQTQRGTLELESPAVRAAATPPTQPAEHAQPHGSSLDLVDPGPAEPSDGQHAGEPVAAAAVRARRQAQDGQRVRQLVQGRHPRRDGQRRREDEQGLPRVQETKGALVQPVALFSLAWRMPARCPPTARAASGARLFRVRQEVFRSRWGGGRLRQQRRAGLSAPSRMVHQTCLTLLGAAANRLRGRARRRGEAHRTRPLRVDFTLRARAVEARRASRIGHWRLQGGSRVDRRGSRGVHECRLRSRQPRLAGLVTTSESLGTPAVLTRAFLALLQTRCDGAEEPPCKRCVPFSAVLACGESSPAWSCGTDAAPGTTNASLSRASAASVPRGPSIPLPLSPASPDRARLVKQRQAVRREPGR